MRRLAVTAIVAACAALAAPTLAPAATPSASTATPVVATGVANTPRGVLHVSVAVHRFFATAAGRTKASGTATATLTPLGGAPSTVTKHVVLSASTRGKCTVLTLMLETLELKLLGLEVHLEKVELFITAEPHGGVLGSLFCALTKAKVKLATRKAAAARVNGAIRRRGAVRPISFGVPLRAQAAASATPTCPILNLVLGPLHLDLLGLVVDLNQVHLTINAEPNGGALGSLFCSVSTTKL